MLTFFTDELTYKYKVEVIFNVYRSHISHLNKKKKNKIKIQKAPLQSQKFSKNRFHRLTFIAFLTELKMHLLFKFYRAEIDYVNTI